jgi:3-deoxy-D-manno-octulosonic-acid transferase
LPPPPFVSEARAGGRAEWPLFDGGQPTTYLLYNSALVVASPALAVGVAARLVRGKSREGCAERCGRLTFDLGDAGRPRLWVHAASVGEVMAVTPILRAYRAMRPDDAVVLSVITPGGHEVAEGMVGKEIDAVFYSPVDVPFAVRRAMRYVRPCVLAVVETELWPNLLHIAHRSGARVALIHGRISDRSFPRYRRVRGLFRWVFSAFDRVLARSDADAERLREIGAPADRVAVLGNAKFDQAPPRLSSEEANALRRDLRLPDGAPVLVVGSTRVAEEEQIALRAYARARERVADLALVYAPRHLERTGDVVTAMRALGLAPVRRTEMEGGPAIVEQIILDTFGELARVFAVCAVAFMGNSMMPPGGGANPLQPLAQGKPVLQGPYVSNFRDISEIIAQAGVARCVTDADTLAGAIVDLVNDEAGRAEIATKAVALVDANRGAAARYAEEIVRLMNAGRS